MKIIRSIEEDIHDCYEATWNIIEFVAGVLSILLCIIVFWIIVDEATSLEAKRLAQPQSLLQGE